ncbi:carboxypeptidase-like regulatory domain-containing protein [Bacteroides thetaiotaomicron]|nr:carboxypeptidase-like regulatory domain-containing protein [Bacteroides thetaiotaomicron]
MRNIFKYGLLAMAIAVTSVGVRAQDIPVSGVVKDKSNNTTLPYASVIVKNESGKTVPQLSTTTDDDGRFSTKSKEWLSTCILFSGVRQSFSQSN